MQRSKIFFSILRLATSFLLSVAICSVFCFFYCNPPLSRVSTSGSTKFTGVPHCFYSTWTEGGSYGKTDANGFLNLTCGSNEEPAEPAILLMGSSHAEALQVMQADSFASLLNCKLPPTLSVYNIAVSGHRFPMCVSRMSLALNEFKPKKYIVLEINDLEFDASFLCQAIEEKSVTSDLGNKFLSRQLRDVVLRIPLIRTFAKRYFASKRRGGTGKSNPSVFAVTPQYLPLLERWLNKVSEYSSEYHVVPIILYHPFFTFQKELNSPHYITDPNALSCFRRACEVNGILFVDMTEDFELHFRETYEPAYGFINTSPGQGHLNKVGHRLIANRLYAEIMALEGACK